MNGIINCSRWLLVLPLGYVAGLVSMSVFCNFFGLLLGGWWLTGCAVCLIGTILQPIIGYHVGQVVAPVKGRVSRVLMLIPYGILWGSATCRLILLLFGSQPMSGVGELFTSVSDWWCTLILCIGTISGCWCTFVCFPSRGKATQPLRPAPFDSTRGSTFDWEKSSR